MVDPTIDQSQTLAKAKENHKYNFLKFYDIDKHVQCFHCAIIQRPTSRIHLLQQIQIIL